MPNFDSFERIFKSVMAADLSSEEGALRISRLSEENKVKVVKGHSVPDLVSFLDRARGSLLLFFPSGAEFTSSDNNKSGKDLYEKRSRTHVELKSGPDQTDANLGLSTVAWALDDHSGDLVSVMKNGLTVRRSMLLNGASEQQIEASKAKTMDDLAAFFKSKLNIGVASDRFSHFFRCIAVGLTKGPEIKSTFRNDGPARTPLLLQASWGSGLELYKKAFLPGEEIRIIGIERTNDRAQVTVKGYQSGRTAKLYPNYKNSWTAPNGQKFPASNWVESACFHVWVH
jgi:hypothetical protein